MINKKLYFLLLLFAGVKAFNQVTSKEQLSVANQPYAAKQVLQRVIGSTCNNIQLELKKSRPEEYDYYEFSAKSGKLTVVGSSPTSLTRGVYDYIKSSHMGMMDRAGNNFHIPAQLPDVPLTKNISPFKIRQAYNVCSFGYTTPYWTWAEWEKELDWQAMHGFNMLLAPTAKEAIAMRVWKKLGLTQTEIDSFYVSPSLLPWQRMGNIQNVGGVLPQEWLKDQIALQHKILNRMRELGMQPVIESFAGFVPKAIKRIYPNIKLQTTLWNSGFLEYQRPVLLMADDPLFAKITKMFMEEWKKEFGDATYFLVDSFNEMQLPQTGKPMTDVLAQYGKLTYDAIQTANPNAVWVIQGWMFGYQKAQWPPENVKALFSKVPDNKILILDYANDYANTWESLNGFDGKQWLYGFLPNAGGKTAYTGDFDLYAKGAARTLNNPKRHNLVGFSISPEGFENNEVIYELLTDVAWTKDSIDLNKWQIEFSINRYGYCSKEMEESWTLLRNSAYKKLIDHPQFNWQIGSFGIGRVNRDSDFFKSVQLFLACRNQVKGSKNYEADAVERAAILLGLKAENWFNIAGHELTVKDTFAADTCFAKGIALLKELDKLMESHPLNRLARWTAFASKHSNNPKLKSFYEADARRIITVWGPPVNDYACRIWSGLIRDFYIPRMEAYYKYKKEGVKIDKNKWELNWVEHSVISKTDRFKNPAEAAYQLVENVMKDKIPSISN